MDRNYAITLICIGVLSFGWAITDTVLSHKNSSKHVDWMCGTITNPDGTREPVKISIEDEFSFDLRKAPGLIHLYRCNADTPLDSIK